MRIKLFIIGVLCLLASGAAKGIEYPDYYCDDEAWSFSLPLANEFHTFGQYKIGDFYYYILDEDKAEVGLVSKEKVHETCDICHLGCFTGSVLDWPKGTYEGDIEIPSEVEIEGKKYSVVMIGYGVFYGCENIRSIKIPESVRFISSYAFRGCINLENLDIPKGTFIAPNCVFDCDALKELDLSNCRINTYLHIKGENITTLKLPSMKPLTTPQWQTYLICSSLKDVWATDAVAPRILIDVSSGIYTINHTVTLHVPRGSAQNYRETGDWNTFKEIVEYDLPEPSGIEPIVPGEDTQKCEYYDIQGRRVAVPESGVYIRRTDEKIEKIIMR